MSNNVFLSICIPTYNRGNILYKNIIKMLANCKYSDVEFVISDNCSTDNTEKLINGIGDTRISYYRNDENILFFNFIKVLSEAKGDFCILLSDEDIINFSKIDKLRKIIVKNKYASIIKIGVYDKENHSVIYGDKSAKVSSLFEKYNIVKNFAYVSGIIFNKKYISNIVNSLDYNNWRETYETKFGVYPHISLSYMIFENGDVVVCPDIFIIHICECRADNTAHNTGKSLLWEPMNRYIQRKFFYNIYKCWNFQEMTSYERIKFYASELELCITLMTKSFYLWLFSDELALNYKRTNPENLKRVNILRRQKHSVIYYTVLGYKMIRKEFKNLPIQITLIDYIRNIRVVYNDIVIMIIKNIIDCRKILKVEKSKRI